MSEAASRHRGTIWWDFDGTLVSRPGHMWSDAGLRFLDQIAPGHTVSRQQLREALRIGLPWRRPDLSHPELSTPDLWWAPVLRRYLDIFAELGCPLSDGDRDAHAIRSDILDAQRYSLFADVVPVLERLHDQGWRHLIVSNHVPELGQIVDALGIGRFFHAVLTSGVVGYEKPHARMFEAALACSVPDAPVWMIGDNVEADCRPVCAVGAQAVLVRTVAPFEPRADDLRAAMDIIGR